MAGFTGHLHLGAATRADGRTVLREQAFRAPFHVGKPYWDPVARTLLVQVVNPTAGILARDELALEVNVGPSAALAVTTPAATRVFRMNDGEAVSRQRFTVEAGGWLEVMPEPLVPHRGSRFRQLTTLVAAPGAGLLHVEQLVPGRVGHGEAWAWSALELETSLRVDGELVLRERLDQTGESLRRLAEAGGSGPAACFAQVVLVAPAEAAPDEGLIAALHGLQAEGFLIGCSPLHRHGWSVKCVARDAVRLRAGLHAARALLARRMPRLGLDLRKL
jgi:urease accessory protein